MYKELKEMPTTRPGYKHTKLGCIPEEWKVVTLRDTVNKGRHITYGIVKPGEPDETGVLMIRSQDYAKGWCEVESIMKVSQSIETPYRRSRVREGDILITVVGANVGKMAVVPQWLDGANISRAAARIGVDAEKANANYIEQILQSGGVDKLIQLAQIGGAQPVLNLKELGGIRIPLPQVPEQRRIAEVLGTWDRAIATAQQLLAAQQQRKRGLMQELLSGKKRFPGFEGKWKEVRLKQLGDITNGGTPSTTEPTYWNGHIPWFTPTEITALNGRTTIENSGRTLTDAGLANCTGSLLPVGSIIVCTRATVGQSAILAVPGTTNQGFKNIVPNEKVSSKFLYYQIAINEHQLKRLACGSTFPEVSMKDFRNLTVLLPDLEEQDRICAVLDTADVVITELQNQIAHLTAQKRGLMQVLLTGEKRLKTE